MTERELHEDEDTDGEEEEPTVEEVSTEEPAPELPVEVVEEETPDRFAGLTPAEDGGGYYVGKWTDHDLFQCSTCGFDCLDDVESMKSHVAEKHGEEGPSEEEE